MTRIMAGWIALTPELVGQAPARPPRLGQRPARRRVGASGCPSCAPTPRSRSRPMTPSSPSWTPSRRRRSRGGPRSASRESMGCSSRTCSPSTKSTWRQANPVYEPPTLQDPRALHRGRAAPRRGRRRLSSGTLAATRESQSRVATWQAKLLGAARRRRRRDRRRDFLRSPRRRAAEVPLSDDAREFISLERGRPQRGPIPEDLETAAPGLRRCAGRGRPAPDWGLASSAPIPTRPCRCPQGRRVPSGTSLVAFAKLGRHRIVKYRLEGQPDGHRANARWEQRRGGWRVGAWIWSRSSEPARLSVLESVLVANRGEIARRDLPRGRARSASAPWPSTPRPTRTGRTCAKPTRPFHRARPRARELSQRRAHPGGRAAHGRRRHPSRLRLPLGELALRQGVRGGRAGLRRPVLACHPADGRQDRRPPPDAAGRRARWCRGATGPVASVRRRAASGGRRDRLSAHAQGRRRGRGHRHGARSTDEADLAQAYATASGGRRRRSATAALFVERYLSEPRHVEVQIFGDADGAGGAPARARVLDPAPPSEARRGEARPRGSRPASKSGLTAAAVAGARAVGYVNAGTMEFIVAGRATSISSR